MFDILITKRCQNIMEKYINKGDIVIDATLGNGNDTKFLAKCVGKEGTVIGIDIQRQAIENSLSLLKNELDKNKYTIKKLEKNEDINQMCINLIRMSHEDIDCLKINETSAIMFNLGYLPNENHIIKTDVLTSLIAIKKGMEMLKKHGVMSIITYKGHDEGMMEHKAITDYLKALSPKKYEVLTIIQTNRNESTPVLNLIKKR